ncbi:MAG: hypothetical protein ACXVQ7_13300 [Actinomycetota bacterium]
MFPFDRSLSAWIGVVWLVVVFVVGFLVTWLVTDVIRVKRTPYVAVLSVVTAALMATYLAWSGAGVAFWTHQWAWGILATVVASVASLVMGRRLPRSARPAHFAELVAWEGVFYGAAEGLLLSVLPVAIMWQALRSFGWTATPAGTVAVLASVALIVVHHLGYWEFRSKLMRYPILFCTVLSVAYLLTGNPIAPIVGHIVLHVAMLERGIEMPPHVHPVKAIEEQVARAA